MRRRYRPQDLGLNCQFVELNRFAHRYRVAKSFQGIVLNGFSPETTAGYSGLFAVFLMWSAFEQFLKVTGVRQNQFSPNDEAFPRDFTIEAVTAADPSFRFYSMIAGKANQEVRRELELFMSGAPFNFTYLASSVRHIFAHGFLTPSANKSRPGAVQEITWFVNDAHFMILDHEFSRRVAALLARVGPMGRRT